MNLCDYGCGKEATHQFKNGKYCCSRNHGMCPVTREKNKIGLSKCITEEFLTKRKNTQKNWFLSENGEKFKQEQRDRMKNGVSQYMNTIPRNPDKLKKLYENTKQRMLNGGALKLIKAIKKISNEELKIRDMVIELYPEAEPQYPVFRYALDVALPEYKIAIEFDGYYHFNKPESIEYYKFRRERIIKEGWKFISYTMFDKFPTKNQIKQDIQKILNSNI